MAWTAPRTWVTSELVTAAIMNTHVRDNLLETAPAKVTAAAQLLVSTGPNAVAARQVDKATDLSNPETTASTSYTDTATAGPAVTVTTSTEAMLFFGAHMSNSSAGDECWVGYAISGATTLAASDSRAAMATSNAADDAYTSYITLNQTVLTAGSNTFTMKYRVTGGTGTFNHRRLTVIPL